MVSKPQTVVAMAELVDTTVEKLVMQLQRFALPWLVASGQRDVVQKVAEYRGDKHLWSPCLDEMNAGPILAMLLIQDVPFAELGPLIIRRLAKVDVKLSKAQITNLMLAETVPTTLHLLKLGAKADEEVRERVSRVLSPLSDIPLIVSVD